MVGVRRPGGVFRQLRYPTLPENADNRLKQQATERTAPIATPPGRYEPPDPVLAFLDGL